MKTLKIIVIAIIGIVIAVSGINEIQARARFAEFNSRVESVEYIENPAVPGYYYRYHMAGDYSMNRREFVKYQDFYF